MVLQRLRLNHHYFILVKLCGQCNLQSLRAYLCRKLFGEVSDLWAMSDTSLLALRSSFVTLSGSSSSLLRSGLLSGALDISLSLCCFGLESSHDVEVMKGAMDEISPQGLVEVIMIENEVLSPKLASQHVIDWQMKLLALVKRVCAPGFAD